MDGAVAQVIISISATLGATAVVGLAGYGIKKLKALGMVVRQVGEIAQEVRDHKDDHEDQRTRDRETMRVLLEVNRQQLRGQRTLLEAAKGQVNGNVDRALEEHRAMEETFDQHLVAWAVGETSRN